MYRNAPPSAQCPSVLEISNFYKAPLYFQVFTLLVNIKGLYNNCLFHLLDLEFRGKPIDEQYAILKPLNLLPYKQDYFKRFF